jgi:PilZ domain-containing protein
MFGDAVSALRRRRYQLLLPLRVWVRGWGKDKAASEIQPQVEEETITENISSAGCYFLLSDEPAIGSRVEMEIRMSPEMAGKSAGKPAPKVICKGRVVRTQKHDVNGKVGVGCAIDRYRLIPASRRS